MSYGSQQFTIPGVVADGDLRSYQFHVVKFANTTSLDVELVTTAAQTGIGILQNAPNDNEAAEVAFCGISKAVAGTSVGWSPGQAVGWNTTARVVPRNTSVYTTVPFPRAIGRYIQTASSVANGDIVTIIITPALPNGLG